MGPRGKWLRTKNCPQRPHEEHCGLSEAQRRKITFLWRAPTSCGAGTTRSNGGAQYVFGSSPTWQEIATTEDWPILGIIPTWKWKFREIFFQSENVSKGSWIIQEEEVSPPRLWNCASCQSSAWTPEPVCSFYISLHLLHAWSPKHITTQ